MLDPAFSKREVDLQRREALSEIAARDDNLAAVALGLLTEGLYRKHPYRQDMLGTARSVSSLTRQQLQRYYRKHFNPSKLVLSVVGDVEPDRLVQKFRQLFGYARPNRGKPPTLPAVQPPSPTVKLRAVKKEQAHVVVGYPGTTLKAKDRFALEVLAALLSGQGGRLFVELRDKQGLAYRVSAFSVEGIEPGYFAAYMATSPDKIEAALAGFEKQFERLRRRAVGLAELGRVKRYLVGGHEISLQRRSTVAAFIALNEVYGLGYRAHTRYAAGIMAVTPADIQRAARRYLDNRRRVISVVHPEELSPGAEAQLGKLRTGAIPGQPPKP